MKIGVFVGSFNPVHKGHIEIVNKILEKGYVDKVIIIPTQNYWDKTNLIDLKDRINMLLTYQNDKITINTELNNLEYTYQVINELKRMYPSDELSLIIGADNIVSFDKWKNYQDLLKLNLIICRRDNIDVESHLKRLSKNDKYNICELDSFGDISSTKIRDNINDIDYLKRFLDDEVINYIVNNNLYK